MIGQHMIVELAHKKHQSQVLAEAANFTILNQNFNQLVSFETIDKSTA